MARSNQCSDSFAEILGRYDLSGAGCGNSASPVLRRGQSE